MVVLRSCRWTPPGPFVPVLLPCRKCLTISSVESFRKVQNTRTGRESWCNSCTAEAKRTSAARHRLASNAREKARYVPRPLHAKECRRCGIGFTPLLRNQQRYCTPECQNRHRWGSRDPVHYHTRRKILKRDGWRCYLCNKVIDSSLRWPHELSGTVDHVIPYSVCQHNRPDNLRAAHWRCNFDKGDSLPGTEVWVPI